MLKRLIPLLLCAFASTAFARDIAPALLDGSAWKMTRADLARDFEGLRYAPVDANNLRFPRQDGISLGELSTGEWLISFDEENKMMSRVLVSVYNKGDDGDMDKEEFDTLLSSTMERLDTLTGVKSKLRKVLQRDSGVKLDARVWETPHGVLLLESAGSGKRKSFNGEFIRLTIGPDADAIERGGARDAAHRNTLKTNTKEEENGDIWIDGIPMVDQGQKGYCVPASVSRVFAYYGMDGVDQHALAALCKSSGDGGTTMGEMESALKDISRKFHIKVIELDKGGMSTFLSDYNAAAKKMKKPGISMRSLTPPEFDTDVLLAARAGKTIQVRKWLKPIQKSIDAGLPVLWSVMLAFPEQGIPQSGGGHMRLIIGYNAENNTIIYSDSWGANHARKEMPAAQACAMTVYRYILRPTR